MVKVRLHSDGPSRFNVLLTEDRPHAAEHWIFQLPRLLEPQGITAYVAKSGEEAIEIAGRLEFHAAIIDLATPLVGPAVGGGSGSGAKAGSREAAGLKLLELFHRLPHHPAMVVIHPPAYQHEADRVLREALRLGAFSVLLKPVEIEQLLGVFRRLLDRRYQGAWPPPRPRTSPAN